MGLNEQGSTVPFKSLSNFHHCREALWACQCFYDLMIKWVRRTVLTHMPQVNAYDIKYGYFVHSLIGFADVLFL